MSGNSSIIRDNNTVVNSGNIILIPESNQMEVSRNNSVINNNNRIEVIPRTINILNVNSSDEEKINLFTKIFIKWINNTNKFDFNDFIDKLNKLVINKDFNNIESDIIRNNVLKECLINLK
jgi:hypothetical protein